jgi:hypothetical protein
MKKSVVTALLTVYLFSFGSLFVSATGQQGEQEEKKNNDNREVTIGRRFLKVTENDTSVNVRIGNRGLMILESLEGEKSEIRIERYSRDENDQFWNDNHDRYSRSNDRPARRFKGNWSGVEFGYNNYTASRNSHFIPGDIGYMDLHSGKSHNFNVNFAQLSLGLSRNIGFVTGLGLNWNNYRFDRSNNIEKGPNGTIVELLPGDLYSASVLDKSKLTTLYLTAPLLLEVQIPVHNNRFNISAGPIGAVKIASHSKMVFEDKNKIKSNGDFNLNILRMGATARAGYSNLQLYGTCYFTSLFRTGRSPGGYDLYPFEVGIALTFNN